MKFKHSNSSQAFELKNWSFGTSCVRFLRFSRNRQSMITTIRQKKMAQATTYSSEAKIASRGYHVYKNTIWVNAKEGDEVQVCSSMCDLFVTTKH